MNNRKAFIDALTELAEKDPKVILVLADIGFSYIEDFKKRFPNQYINVGVTEQTAMAMCAGLALSGWKPYWYSMINFSVMRPYEFLRTAVYHNANVKILGIKGSEHYKMLGHSHNLFDGEHEDQILGHLPNITTHYPQSPEETSEVIKQTYGKEGPAYIRL